MRKRTLTAILIAASLPLGAWAEGEHAAQNVLEDVPYVAAGMGKRELVNEKHLLVMQAALMPGQSVPQHNANSNVHLLILEGAVVAVLDGDEIAAKEGDLLPVALGTPMSIRNASQANATFLIIKAPHPSQVE